MKQKRKRKRHKANMSHEILGEIIDTLNELKRMHQLNYELLEQLNIVCGYLRENHIKLPNEEKFVNLLSRAMALLNEIQAITPKTFQYQKISRRKVTDSGTDGEVTEPSCAKSIRCLTLGIILCARLLPRTPVTKSFIISTTMIVVFKLITSYYRGLGLVICFHSY